MGKKQNKAIEIGQKAIESYMILIAQVEAIANPMVKDMLEIDKLRKDAFKMYDELDSLRGESEEKDE